MNDTYIYVSFLNAVIARNKAAIQSPPILRRSKAACKLANSLDTDDWYEAGIAALPLTETDGNATTSAPTPTANKKARMSLNGGDLETAPAAKPTTASSAESEATTADNAAHPKAKKSATNERAAHPDHVKVLLGWRRPKDADKQNPEDEDDEEEYDDDEDEDESEDGNGMLKGETINAIVSKAGIELAEQWAEEASKRCPDEHDIYVYNDFEGYGLCEVMENQVGLFFSHQSFETHPLRHAKGTADAE